MPDVLLPVPHHKQTGEHHCLPACAKMVMAYFGREISEATLALQLGSTALGTPGNRLLRLGNSDLNVFFGPLTLPLIYDYLNDGIPIIILVSTIFLDYHQEDFAHAVVLVGYNDDHLLINDPMFAEAPQRASPTGFLAAWGEFDFVGGVITPISD